MKLNVILAIFKRNFASYFANPTGYVFICGFVLASGFAAFWPHEFFNANLANLDQLNTFLPFIMLGFVPAITMSIWADERRQGTDELLLTIPASDVDVVAGKYLAAVAIFTVSLLFSLTNIIVLSLLGDPDIGLMLTTYLGYWLVGLAMLAIGMVGSFLTRNLTVAFVLGVAFNAPLVFASSADVIVSGSALAHDVKQWGIASKFVDLSRGVISLSSLLYFAALIAIGLYISVVLIGRRHWKTGAEGGGMWAHYTLRTVAVVLAAAGMCMVVAMHDLRVDTSSEGLSSLSPQTFELLKKLEEKRGVHIEAYISPESEVPESYIQTRLNLLTMLDELDKRGGGNIAVTINETESFKQIATIAEQRFGIEGVRVRTRDRGKFRESEIWLGVAVTSGLDKVVIPFFDRGIPVEYELIRSIVSLADKQKRTIGLVSTDARLMGSFNPQTMSQTPKEAIITELEKQYDVKEVDLTQPVTERFDVLLAVQPSSLPDGQLAHLLAAIRSGQKTAIFEDPLPIFMREVPGTSEPRRSPGGNNPFMRQPPPAPKGNIAALWRLLGVDFTAQNVIWQEYNPYPKAEHFPNEFVFVDEGCGQEAPFNMSDPITSGLQQVAMLFPGAISPLQDAKLKFEPLVQTGKKTGTVSAEDVFTQTFFGSGGLNPFRETHFTGSEYTLAARITGTLPALSSRASLPDSGAADNAAANGDSAAAGGDRAAPAAEKPAEATAIDVVLVADIDTLSSAFFAVRNEGENPDADLQLNLDNVTFVLNVIDVLAGDMRFVDIRKKRRTHRTLTAFEAGAASSRIESKKAREKFRDDFEAAIKEEEKKINERIEQIQKTPGIDQRQFDIQLETARAQLEKSLTVKRAQLERERDRQIKQVEADLELQIRGMQNRVKRAAVFLPPILPLAIGAVVFLVRRGREYEGAAPSRMR